ncbi:F-box domain-containing protein [Rutstroemia sp. NJR-2017a BVV2]|nr:F-box domain-containing protein [Rutstroemia sp. NJR-2017a BVV2]
MMNISRNFKPTPGFKQCFEEEMRKLVIGPTMSLPTRPSLSESLSSPADDSDEMTETTRKRELLHLAFITTPPEIILQVYRHLNPIDTICFSLINKYIRNIYTSHLHNPNHLSTSLSLGSPSSPHPVPTQSGCRHCVPVLHYPAHCQLHYHLRSFMPAELNYCAGQCQKYTSGTGSADGVARECAACGRSYRKQYERGRRMLDMMRDVAGEGQGMVRRTERLRKWYEQTQYEGTGRRAVGEARVRRR